jgi:hypothetical protein
MKDAIAGSPGLVTYFIFEVNHLLDSKEHRDTLSFAEARKAAEEGRVIKLLREKYPGEIDLSLFDDEREASFNEKIADIAGGLYNRERRKTGVENNGLNLLLAYGIELLQQMFPKVIIPGPFVGNLKKK